MALVLGIDVSTTATKAVLVDEPGAVARRSGRPSTGLDAPQPLWSEQDPAAVVGRRRRRDPGALAAAGAAARRRGRRPHRPDARRRPARRGRAVLRPAILWNDQRTAAECDEIREAWPRAADRDHRQRRAHRLHRAEAASGSATTSRTSWARLAHVLLPKDYLRLRLTGEHALDKADGAGTLLFDLAARDWSSEVLGALRHPSRLAAADVRGPAGHRVDHAGGRRGNRAPRRHAGRCRRRRPGGERRRRRRRDPGSMALSLGTSGVIFAATDRPLASSRAAASTPSATRSRLAGT